MGQNWNMTYTHSQATIAAWRILSRCERSSCQNPGPNGSPGRCWIRRETRKPPGTRPALSWRSSLRSSNAGPFLQWLSVSFLCVNMRSSALWELLRTIRKVEKLRCGGKHLARQRRSAKHPKGTFAYLRRQLRCEYRGGRGRNMAGGPSHLRIIVGSTIHAAFCHILAVLAQLVDQDEAIRIVIVADLRFYFYLRSVKFAPS